MAAVPSAAMLPQAVPVEVTKVEDTTGTVFKEVCVRVRTKRNSVQLKMKQSTAVAATPPMAMGSTILRKIRKREGAVDQRRFVDLCRDVVEEALQQQNRERQVHQRMDQNDPHVRVEQPEILVDKEHRDRDGHRRHHTRRENPEDEMMLPFDAHTRQGIGREHRDCDREDGREKRHDDAVDQPGRHVKVTAARNHFQAVLEAQGNAKDLLERLPARGELKKPLEAGKRSRALP